MCGQWVCVMFALFQVCGSFNLSPTQLFTYHNRESYFGYTVALQRRGSEHWVIVGAPRANSSLLRSVVEPGEVFECDIQSTDCSPIDLVQPRPQGSVHTSKFIFKPKEDNAWIGGALDVQNQDGGRIVACGSRYINHGIGLSPPTEYYRTIGACFVKDFTSDRDVELLTPLNDKGKFTIPRVPSGNNSHVNFTEHFYQFGQAGFSVHFATKNKNLLMGAPGLWQWIGTVIKYEPYSKDDGNEFVGSTPKNRLYGSPLTPNPGKIRKLTQESYFGYSIDSGALYAKDGTVYVAGAPRGAALKGKVIVFDFLPNAKNYSELKILAEMEGTQIGEYFGAVVCAVDLNADGLDDLVVGAPLFTLSLNHAGTYNQYGSAEGRIYVFLNGGMGIFTHVKNSILGLHLNGRFGSAVSRIGDINKDGYNDIAVGAPYGGDLGRGAIYIYHGSKEGLNPRPSQQISAVSINSKLSGFGISISRGLDVDGNTYNDIAVGAYSSGHVVLLTSRKVIKFRTYLEARSLDGQNTSRLESIEKNTKQFYTSACVSYTGQLLQEPVYVNIKLVADARTKFVKNGENVKVFAYTIVLKTRIPKCKDILTNIIQLQNYQSPLEIKMNFLLDITKGPQNALGFCSSCPVVDPSEPDYNILNLPFTTARTDLKIEASITEPDLSIVLGTRPRLKISVSVLNSGAVSVLSTIALTIPSQTILLGFGEGNWIKKRNRTDTSLEWSDLEVEAGATQELELWMELDTLRVHEKVRELVFTFQVSSDKIELEPKDNTLVISVPARSEADVAIFGISNQIHEKMNAGVNQNFSHTYIVRNFGPSAVTVLKLRIEIPATLMISGKEAHFVDVFEPEPILDNQPFVCTHVNGPKLNPRKSEGGETTDPIKIKKKRSISDSLEKSPAFKKYPSERTLVVNCSSTNFTCVTVECIAGPFLPNTSMAVVSFHMEVNFEHIEPIMGRRDILVITSTGSVTLESEEVTQPTGHRGDMSSASTVFYGEKVPWIADEVIYYAAGALGIIILILIVLFCWMCGFFKRRQKEENLLQQKQEERKPLDD